MRPQTALQDRFEAIVGSAASQASAIGDALFGIAGMLASTSSVRRALTDAGRDAESREALASQLFSGRVDNDAVEIVATAVGARWARPSELVSTVAELGVQAHLVAAEARGQLESVQDEVFRFSQILRGEPALRSALIDRSAPAEARRQLIHGLLQGKAAPETVRLVEFAALERGERSLDRELERIIELAAARNRRRVAVVRVASPLSAGHRDRLQDALSTQAGVPVSLNVVVEPSLVGGIKVEIGDDVVDGTVLGRLSDTRRRLVAG